MLTANYVENSMIQMNLRQFTLIWEIGFCLTKIIFLIALMAWTENTSIRSQTDFIWTLFFIIPFQKNGIDFLACNFSWNQRKVHAFLEKADLEYYFKTKDNSERVISIEVDKNDQSIPLVDGTIKVETFPKKTEVCFRLRDQERFRIINFYFGSLDHGIIPKSAKKSKTLGDVKKVVPTFLQQILEGGKTIKYFFDDNANGDRKELILDSEELPTINGKKTIICWIMVSQHIGKKLSQRRNYMRYSILITYFLTLSVGLTCTICLPTMNYISDGAGLILSRCNNNYTFMCHFVSWCMCWYWKVEID